MTALPVAVHVRVEHRVLSADPLPNEQNVTIRPRRIVVTRSQENDAFSRTLETRRHRTECTLSYALYDGWHHLVNLFAQEEHNHTSTRTATRYGAVPRRLSPRTGCHQRSSDWQPPLRLLHEAVLQLSLCSTASLTSTTGRDTAVEDALPRVHGEDIDDNETLIGPICEDANASQAAVTRIVPALIANKTDHVQR